MNIDDILNNKMDDDKPRFNVEDDLQCYMRDDTQFYRTQYYPTMAKCQECYNKGDSDKAFGFILPMIDQGVDTYIKKYDLPYDGNKMFTMDERKSLAKKIFDEEVNAFKEGEY
jgi:hypothetical protein